MKIISAIPIRYTESGSFWSRDLGLVTLAFRRLGIDANFAALGPGSTPEDKPLILPTLEQLADSSWWQSQKPDAIILNTWSAPRHHRIRLAALSVGCPLVEKLDTDGVKSPRIFPTHSLRRGLVAHDLRYPIRSGIPKKIEAILRFLVTYAFPALLDRRMISCMSQVQVYAAETPVASERVRRFLRIYNASPMPTVVTIPHPVDIEQMDFAGTESKFKHIISIGRWDDAVKGWPLLRDVVRRFLTIRPDWKFFVAGAGAENEGARLEKEFPGRFTMLGRLPHSTLNAHLRNARIYFLPSHSETFNIAGAEALCCGCSLVGPAQIPSSFYFASQNSGTVSFKRDPAHMCDALAAEASEWEQGKRNPKAISDRWRATVGSEAVAKQYLELFQAMISLKSVSGN